ncbi:hypothetical protein AWC38_SpisGene7512 [Stylophora pistillata]|uniref:C2H2-type domain-containing protein n=1 Tax=Stylophora pistillata TaxID=50429 RepID=A0A2B4SEG3_STYPI|nr:hypothetical protein AWC38_SpisGene7512 [Stylophora pistillata]
MINGLSAKLETTTFNTEIAEKPKTSAVMLLDGSQSMTANLDLGNQKAINLAAPSASTDLCNKTFVDGELQKTKTNLEKHINDHLAHSIITYLNNDLDYVMNGIIGNEFSDKDDITGKSMSNKDFHKFYKKVKPFELNLDSSKGYYSSRFGVNMYSAAKSEYTAVREMWWESNKVDTNSVTLSVTSSVETISRQRSNRFSNHIKPVVAVVVKKSSQIKDGGALFDVGNSHSIGEAALKGLGNSGVYLARQGAAKAVKSDFVKSKIKQTASKYLDQVLDSFANDLSKKLSGVTIAPIDYSQWYPMEMYAPGGVNDPTNPLYTGYGIDIHKIITGEIEYTPAHFLSNEETNYQATNLDELYDKMTGKIIESLSNYQMRGSNWAFDVIEGFEIHTVMNDPLGGSSYIPLPEVLANKMAITKMKNNDQEYFKWCVTRSLHPVTSHPERIAKILRKQSEKLCFNGLKFPLSLRDIDKFEKLNPTLRVNARGSESKIYPSRVSENKTLALQEINLLLISDDEKSHYCLINDMSRLLSSQKSNKNKNFFCLRCLNCFGRQDLLDKHKSIVKTMRRLRSKAKNEFEKDFFKLMNNSAFGKTMENLRNRIDLRLVNNEKSAKKLAAKPNFKNCTIFSENLVAMNMKKTEIIFDKPVYLGMSILDLSKTLMYDFHYNYIKPKYGERAKLLFTDADSLCYEIETDDFFKDIASDVKTMFDRVTFLKIILLE